VLALLLGGCSSGGAVAPQSTQATKASATTTAPAAKPAAAKKAAATGTATTVPASFPAYAATAISGRLDVRSSPGGPTSQVLANPQPSGAPLTFLLKERRGDWMQVFLPVRPNGSTGWVRSKEVKVAGLAFRLEILRGSHQLRLFRFGKLVATFPVGIGTGDTPTPGGTFYLKELIAPTNQNGPYGRYAFGLSGFSNVLTSFAGGTGVIGIHGTNDPGSVGKDVSHGCIRMHNADITALAGVLPLGTPVHILA